MDKRKILQQISIDAEVYDLKLASMVGKAFSEAKPTVISNICYGLEIIFDKSVYQKREFYQYPLSKKSLHPRGQEPKTEQEKMKQKIYDVLNEQLDHVTGVLEAVGYKFGSAAIIGDNVDGNCIKIILYEEDSIDTGKGEKQPFKAYSIVPDRPALTEQFAKEIAKYFLEQMQKDQLRDIAKQQHTPNLVIADSLFAAIAHGMVSSDNSAANDLKNNLLNQAYLETDWPLKIGRNANKTGAEPIMPDSKIDCPEFMIFHQFVGGHWTLEEIKNLKEAQQYIVKKGYALKQTKSVIVLHNLSPVPYSLLQDTEDGLVMVPPDEARGRKNLQVIWNKRTEAE